MIELQNSSRKDSEGKMASSTDETVKRSGNREARLSRYTKSPWVEMIWFSIKPSIMILTIMTRTTRCFRLVRPAFHLEILDIEPLLYEAAELITMDDSEEPVDRSCKTPAWRPSGQRFQHLYCLPSQRPTRNCRRTGIPLMPPARPDRRTEFHRCRGRAHNIWPGDVVLTPAIASIITSNQATILR